MMRRLPILLGGMTLIAGAWACDSLTDPHKSAADAEPASSRSRVSGALSAPEIPTNARVAIVWRNRAGITPGAEAAIVDGHFSLDLDPPADDLFVGADGYGDDSPLDAETLAANQGWSRGETDSGPIRTQTGVSGTVGGGGAPIESAYAGFVVYVDTNGNGKLDFDKAGTVQDRLLGGSNAFALVYLRHGSTIDYERLRGVNGVLPTEGYNLRWSDLANDRWFPLDQVQLELKPYPLPVVVCERMTDSSHTPTHFAEDAGTDISCFDDGYTIGPCSTQNWTDALCNTGYENTRWCFWSATVLRDAGTPIPADWPCPIADGGPEITDAGQDEDATFRSDAGVDDAGAE